MAKVCSCGRRKSCRERCVLLSSYQLSSPSTHRSSPSTKKSPNPLSSSWTVAPIRPPPRAAAPRLLLPCAVATRLRHRRRRRGGGRRRWSDDVSVLSVCVRESICVPCFLCCVLSCVRAVFKTKPKPKQTFNHHPCVCFSPTLSLSLFLHSAARRPGSDDADAHPRAKHGGRAARGRPGREQRPQRSAVRGSRRHQAQCQRAHRGRAPRHTTRGARFLEGGGDGGDDG